MLLLFQSSLEICSPSLKKLYPLPVLKFVTKGTEVNTDFSMANAETPRHCSALEYSIFSDGSALLFTQIVFSF